MSKSIKQGTSFLAIKQLVVGKNVRTPSPEGLGDLVASIKASGIIQPLLVRKKAGKHELVCGHRRLAAAREAGLTDVPVFVRELDDHEALTAQIVENLQREGTHALDEADAYRRLQTTAKLDVARIAERVGRSVPYVYDRLRLADLVSEAKELFRANAITPGHAVVLARLKPADQKLAIKPEKGGLFEHENLLFSADEHGRAERSNGFGPLKLVTVRELQGWIDKHVKFDVKAPDLPQLFPDTAAALATASEKAEKIVPITEDYSIHPLARDGQRVLGPRSWKRADGQLRSKLCDHSVTGVIVVGPGRGQTLKVCIDRNCSKHWAEEKREAEKRAKDSQGSKGPSAAAIAKAAAERRAEQAREEALEQRFKKAVPAIAEALAAAIAKIKTPAKGPLADLVVKGVVNWHNKKFSSVLKRGKTAEDLLRWCAFMMLANTLGEYRASREIPKLVKPFGVDVAKIMDQVAPAKDEPTEKPATSGVCSKCGCTDAKPCKGGCSWANGEETLCSACVDEDGEE